MHPWEKAIPPGPGGGNAPSHCKTSTCCSNILLSPLLQAVTFGNPMVGLNNSFKQIN